MPAPLDVLSSLQHCCIALLYRGSSPGWMNNTTPVALSAWSPKLRLACTALLEISALDANVAMSTPCAWATPLPPAAHALRGFMTKLDTSLYSQLSQIPSLASTTHRLGNWLGSTVCAWAWACCCAFEELGDGDTFLPGRGHNTQDTTHRTQHTGHSTDTNEYMCA